LLLTPDIQVPLSELVGPIVGRDSLEWLGVPISRFQTVAAVA